MIFNLKNDRTDVGSGIPVAAQGSSKASPSLKEMVYSFGSRMIRGGMITRNNNWVIK